MLRRTVCALGLAGSLPSPSSCFNILLDNVLRMTRYPPGKRSVNEFIEEHAPRLRPLRHDLWLLVWKTFTEQKKSLMPGDVIARNQPAMPQHEVFDLMIQGLKQAARKATKCGDETLDAAWINSLADYRKASPERLQRVDTEVVGQLNAYVKEIDALFALLDEAVGAFKHRVDKQHNMTGKFAQYARHLKMPELTHRHEYKEGVNLGATPEWILRDAFPDVGYASANPVIYVVGGACQGKSLMLTEVVNSAARYGDTKGQNFGGVAMTFSDPTPLGEDEVKDAFDVQAQFWGRVVFAWYRAMEPKNVMTFEAFRSAPFFKSIGLDVARALAESLGIGRLVIAADDMCKLTSCIARWKDEGERAFAMDLLKELYGANWSLLCSGVTEGDATATITSIDFSPRGTTATYLNTLTHRTRGGAIAGMLHFLEEEYPGEAFTPKLRTLFEVVKNVPGYVGLWVELNDKHRVDPVSYPTKVRGLNDLRHPMLDHLSAKLAGDCRLFSRYWRAVANNGDTFDNHLYAMELMKGPESLGILLPAGCNARYYPSSPPSLFLSPLVFAHPMLSGAHEYPLIQSAISRLGQCSKGTSASTYDALGGLIEVALVLNAMYVNDVVDAKEYRPCVTVGSLIKRLCGEVHCTAYAASTFDVSLPVVFPDYRTTKPHEIVKEADLFLRSLGAKRSLSRRTNSCNKTIATLQSADVSVLRHVTTCGAFERAVMFRAGTTRKKVLLIFVTTPICCRLSGSSRRVAAGLRRSATKQVLRTLTSVCKYVKPCNIRRVCFVHCSMPGSLESMYQFTRKDALDAVMKRLAKKGKCTTSLHCVQTDEQWRALLDCLYLVAPDIGMEERKHGTSYLTIPRCIDTSHAGCYRVV
ncbi:Hypothetical protein, putative [Bodo saltans]|uniref:Uncharacterized protein n=1 Tax=Bodo saltans TaxID=75058 RepID=A0A0S4JJW6_BODSA|nr:Hypothetical protein, putative [Bodo saltans]|eukprot:CUG90383.1 Hypothetical protein, putative [Bodo saltans]